MVVISRIITKKNYRIWINALNKFSKDQNSIFNHPNYLNLYEDKNKISSCYIYADNKYIFIYPFLISKILKAKNFKDIETAYGYGGPICNTTNKLFLKNAFLNLRSKLIKKNIIAELIKFNPYSNNDNVIKYYDGKIINEKDIIYVDLKNLSKEEIFKNYKKSCKKKLKKILLNKEIKIKIENTRDSLKNFKKLYDESMKRLNAKESYFKNDNFYSKIHKNMKNNFFVFSLIDENEIQTSQLLLFDKNNLYCHMYGSTDKAKKNSLILLSYHRLINWAKDKKFNYIDFGGGRTSEMNDSLLNFKKNFSITSKNLYIGEMILNDFIYEKLIKNSKNNNAKLFKYR